MHNYTIGRGGFITPEDKREGDGATPLGIYPLREVWYRPDRLNRPVTKLPVHEITQDDGWCDTPEHSLYNKHFKISEQHTLPESFEQLWREDHAYDIIVVLGYNDDPVVPHKGSAIFMHLNHDDGRPTAGCIAMDEKELLALLFMCSTKTKLQITRENIAMV